MRSRASTLSTYGCTGRFPLLSERASIVGGVEGDTPEVRLVTRAPEIALVNDDSACIPVSILSSVTFLNYRSHGPQILAYC